MKDLKKLWRMQGGFFILAFCVMEAIMVLFMWYFRRDVETIWQWQSQMQSFGFVSMHGLLLGLTGLLLLIRRMFVAGKENEEFVYALPVKRRSWQLFTTLAGVLLFLCIYAVTLLVYAQMGGALFAEDELGMPEVADMFAKGYVCSVLEYHGLLLAGGLFRRGTALAGRLVQNRLEGAEEK